MTCQQQHRYDQKFSDLPDDQSTFNGRHRCAGCAYEAGHDLGTAKSQTLNLDYATLPDSQAGEVRHKSVQAAFAQGYLDGVLATYE